MKRFSFAAHYWIQFAPKIIFLKKSTSRKRSRGKHRHPALARLLAQKPLMVSIPGTTKLEHLDENTGTLEIEVTSDALREINSATSKITVQGTRPPEEHMNLIDS